MPPVKPIDQVQEQGKRLRKLRSLLQRWRQSHGHESACSDSYLYCAMLFGAAHYLTRLGHGSDSAHEITFVEAVAILQDLWPRALEHSRSPLYLQSHSLDGDFVVGSSVQREFFSLVKHRLVGEIFNSPLCPSHIYEAFSWEERRTSKVRLQDERKLVETCHLISFTQVYTPPWIVDHLLQNTLGRALSAVTEPDLPKLQNITILDPALGGGVFLVEALSSCVQAYNNLGLTAYDATKYSLRFNLFGLDIDPVALSTAALALILKAFSLGLNRLQVANLLPLVNLCLIDGDDEGGYPLGALSKDLRKIQDHALSRPYDVVVTNPPYLGRKLLPRPLKVKLKRYYPDAASDLSQAFLSMALDLVKPGGRVGFITQGSFLHLASAKSLRERILKEHQLIQVVELGAGVFPLLAGEKASTALIVIKNNRPTDDQQGHYLSLVAAGDKSSLLKEAWGESERQLSPEINEDIERTERIEAVRRQADFLKAPNLVINYLQPPAVARLKSKLPKLADIATLKQGLATTDNARFLRFIWEVGPLDIPDRFVPYARGEGAQRWWSPLTTVVLWEDNGRAIKEAVTAAYPYLKGNYSWVVKNEDYYFKSGLTFSFVSKDRLTVRQLPAGAIFDVGSSAIFVHNTEHQGALLAYLNSTLATAMAHDLNPTINFQVGDLKKLVVPNFTPEEQEILSTLASACVAAKERLFVLSSPLRFFRQAKGSLRILITADSFNLAQTDFARTEEELIACEQEIDKLVMLAAIRDVSPEGDDGRAIENFAYRPKQKTYSCLGAAKFCHTGLMEAMLGYFYKSQMAMDEQASVLIASLKHEEDADCFIKFWPGSIDLSFLRAHLGHDKGLTHYIREELPRAFNDSFQGQTPLLFIKGTSGDSGPFRDLDTAEEQYRRQHTLIIVPPLALLLPQLVTATCGDLSPNGRERALELLQQARTIKGLNEMRAKEMVGCIAGIEAHAAGGQRKCSRSVE